MIKKRKQMKLQLKLLLSIIMLLIVSVSLSSYFISEYEVNKVEQKEMDNLENAANLIAASSTIQEQLYLKNTDVIQGIVERHLLKLNDIEIITIADMDGIRYGHPNKDRLGEKFVGGDELRVIETGETYSSVATGTLGRSIRVFVPIIYNGEQVGFVMAAHKYDQVMAVIDNIRQRILVYGFFSIVIGGIGAILISFSIKKSLLNLEPNEIAKLYLEKEIILKSTREGIMAIDLKGNITLMNDSAKRILDCEDQKLIGEDILKVFPSTRLMHIMKTGEAEHDREQLINETQILSNRVPIYDSGEIIGAMATFKDLSDVVTLAEEMTGVKQIVKALRATTHEFKNKLHLIQGLIELQEYDELREYMKGLNRRYTKIQELVSGKLKNSTINALIIGKLNIASEEKIDLQVTSDSLLLCEGYTFVTDAMVIILGNLLENAIESVKKSKRDDGLITLYINDQSENIVIEVTDNGIGIEESNLEKIFSRGYTTKKGSNGVGLDLVSSKIERLGGEIEVTSDTEKGTIFTVIIPIE